MRLWGLTALLCLAAAGCGGGGDEAEQGKARGGRELTVTLPPTLPTVPAEKQAPEAGFETIAAVEVPVETPPEPAKAPPAPKQREPQAIEQPAEVEVAVAPAAEPGVAAEAPVTTEGGAPAAAAETPAGAVAETRPAGASNWAAYIRKAGFPCGRVASTNRIERSAGPGLQFYRVECEGGRSYQATNKRGHLYFRRWRG